MDLRFCQHCEASLTSQAKFCGNCGRLTLKGKREHRRESRDTHGRMRAISKAVALVYVGTLVGMVLVHLLVDAEPEIRYLIAIAVDLVLCSLAVWTLGGGSFRASFGRPPDLAALVAGVAVPCVSLPVAILYVSLFTDTHLGTGDGLTLSLLLFVAVLPALVEEWMCRGVLWVALRPVTSQAVTIDSTAALFAFLHGLNGGFIFELPHRFVMGLLLGWLRARTGSMWPCVLAHFLHNAAAVALFD